MPRPVATTSKLTPALGNAACKAGVPLILAVGACAALLLAISLPARSAPIDKAAVEQIVADYIAQNGDKLKESLIAAERKAQQAAITNMITPDTPTRGEADAPVTVVEFGNFFCPYCIGVQPTLETIEKAYAGKLRFAFKHLPFNPMMKPASYAALAAHKQGKYWEYAELLWANPSARTEADFTRYAQQLKLDLARFNADRTSPDIIKQVEADLDDAQAVEARGTPFFFINGQPLSGALPEAEFRKVIDAALAAATPK